ncbi:hypothetical protein CK203_033828 [Vitis vinifera]|uniref:Retrotransposon gag domain-containing protein n=1 Tax=Vitis vinifera TaxID=29760 RepID=A0A438IQ84_VITVI|nr:hypothetical protein CK203_033828 [Vitis vinifera]
MDTQQSRHVVLEDTPSDLVTPPVLPVQMPATQTLPTVSHDHAAVIPPMVTPVTVIEDPHSLATLPVGFRMPDIERYTGVGCPRIHLRLYSTVMRALGLDEVQLLTLFPLSLSGMTQRWYASLGVISSENLGGLSTGVSETVFIRLVIRALHVESLSFLDRDQMSLFLLLSLVGGRKAAEMIERPTERDQMSMFFRSLHPRFARHLTGVPFQDFRSLVQALFDVDDGISRGLWSDIIPSPDTEGKKVGGSSEDYGDICSTDFQHRRPGYHSYARSLQIPRSDFHLYSIVILIQFSSTLLCILILSRCDLHVSFSVHRLASHGMSSLVLIGDVRGLILIWGMPLDRAFERLRSTGDLIDSGAVSFPISTTDTDLGPDMTADSFPAWSAHAVSPPSGLYHHVLGTQGTDIHRTL